MSSFKVLGWSEISYDATFSKNFYQNHEKFVCHKYHYVLQFTFEFFFCSYISFYKYTRLSEHSRMRCKNQVPFFSLNFTHKKLNTMWQLEKATSGLQSSSPSRSQTRQESRGFLQPWGGLGAAEGDAELSQSWGGSADGILSPEDVPHVLNPQTWD